MVDHVGRCLGVLCRGPCTQQLHRLRGARSGLHRVGVEPAVSVVELERLCVHDELADDGVVEALEASAARVDVVVGPPSSELGAGNGQLARAVLRRAVELGVNHIDTSQVYGPDVVNELIAEVLHPYPEDLVIATKVGGARDDQGGWIRASRPEQLRATVEADLRLLRLERIDLVNLRCGVGGPEPDTVPLAEQLDVLTDLRDEGKLDLIGISTVSADAVEAALEITPVAEVQNEPLLSRRP
jgi:hypothetical protein